jgi:hypothetical protein
LADFGLPIAVQEAVKLVTPDDRKDWREKIARGERVILEIARLPDGSLLPHCHTGNAAMAGGQALSAVSINLGEALAILWSKDVIVPHALLTPDTLRQARHDSFTVDTSDIES